jgi:hypothetical protein
MNNEPTSEQKPRDAVKEMRSALIYIEDDIGIVMARVRDKPYKYAIPNLYEKLTLFGDGLTIIKERLKNILNQIDSFENQLSGLSSSDNAGFDSDILEEYNVIGSQMEELKSDYKLLKSKIILFTGGLEKNV